ncbi:GMC oxidoreductase [Cylindrobasidium torrendii FP15055 ss-10]|uniref:GMC oxidoreductase n=1 Tax=Cylindrobasidium torrendii FP15055 ss-10 TaxID=1314674 RepID=A0A0D7BI17_9AGAR|nr:GMC oxidoreductase [Cylindrobasidium torrendii FP15055 ss-10]
MWPIATAATAALSLAGVASSSRLSARNIVYDGKISDSYDFVIVGGGTAGLVLASRLSEDSNTTVLVLEAGHTGDDVYSTIAVPDGTYFQSLTKSEYDYAFTTSEQSNMNNRGLPWPRGKVLGGSSAINGMYHVRPAQVEVESWHDLLEGADGDDNWTWDSFYAAMKKSEIFTPPTDETAAIAGIEYDASVHGTDGMIHTSYPGFQFGLNGNWTPTLNSLGVASRKDGAGAENWGAYITQSYINPTNWTRSFTRSAFIDPLPQRDNLQILADATVTKIVFEKGDSLKATSVEYAGSATASASSVKVNKEVILAAGVIGSPQILQLSGVGPSDVLTAAGVEVQSNLPGVGQHMQDHLVAAVYWSTDADTAGKLHTAGVNTPEFLSYINSATAYVNLTTLMGAEGANTLLTSIKDSASDATRYVPSADSGVLAGYSAMYEQSVSLMENTPTANIELLLALTGDGAVGIQAGLQHPLSPGRVYITTASAFDSPTIDPGYLAHSADLAVLREGMKMARKIGQTEPMSLFLGNENSPGDSVSTDEQWESWIKDNAGTEYHPHGSCSMRPQNKGGVINPKLIVYGTSNVRIADSSVFPIDMSCHLEAPTIAVAEKAAEIIRTQYNVKGGDDSSSSSGSGSDSGSSSGNNDDDNNDAAFTMRSGAFWTLATAFVVALVL